eukprot:TRINITY_DN2609_c0_g1_i1.p1 TRINITY_DN2609_c0_g1~~TRINITY_DN2609_c0_g1_i1.p1  ORF type:complete len:263 (+),score=-24.86 TRINITY_DN2609_c0_g1_i1:351-1139(+)
MQLLLFARHSYLLCYNPKQPNSQRIHIKPQDFLDYFLGKIVFDQAHKKDLFDWLSTKFISIQKNTLAQNSNSHLPVINNKSFLIHNTSRKDRCSVSTKSYHLVSQPPNTFPVRKNSITYPLRLQICRDINLQPFLLCTKMITNKFTPQDDDKQNCTVKFEISTKVCQYGQYNHQRLTTHMLRTKVIYFSLSGQVKGFSYYLSSQACTYNAKHFPCLNNTNQTKRGRKCKFYTHQVRFIQYNEHLFYFIYIWNNSNVKKHSIH